MKITIISKDQIEFHKNRPNFISTARYDPDIDVFDNEIGAIVKERPGGKRRGFITTVYYLERIIVDDKSDIIKRLDVIENDVAQIKKGLLRRGIR